MQTQVTALRGDAQVAARSISDANYLDMFHDNARFIHAMFMDILWFMSGQHK